MTSPHERETTLRQVLRLVDFSRDLQRNHDDRAFAEAGGEFRYVMDENIFEMFIRPKVHRDGVETFYADVWSGSPQAPSEWDSFESQAAMIASEALIQRRLPGTRSDNLWMTEPHRWELAHRVDALTNRFAKDWEARPEAFRESLQRKIRVLKDLADHGRKPDRVIFSATDGDTLVHDLADLRKAASINIVNRTRVARRAAEMLAEDELTEPLEQLRRVASPEMRGRVCGFQSEFHAADSDLAAIENEAELWFERIAEELRRPGNSQRKRAKNPKAYAAAILNDARSIAYLRWVANTQLKPNERLAFVTGDLVIFDAYRRWHASVQSGSDDANEPFLMRRATQYSPIFNIDTIASDFGEAAPGSSALFSLIEQAVETALLPLTYATASESEPKIAAIPGSRRELLALKLVDTNDLLSEQSLSAFATQLSSEWLTKQREQIENVRLQWQKAHRVTIGASFDLISGRLNEDQLKIVEEVAYRPTEEAGQVLNSYLGNVLEKLLEDSLQLWLPLAETFAARRPIADMFASRFSAAMVLPKPSEAGSLPILLQTAVVFGTAAIQALEWQDPSNANRFANLAVRAGATHDIENNPFPVYEREYLCAVTHRFLIGMIGEQFHRRPDTPRGRTIIWRAITDVKQRYAHAARLIHGCIARHFVAMPESPYHRVRFARAVAERAALHLFMSCAMGLVKPSENSDLLSDAFQYMEIAKGDLRICLEQTSLLETQELDDTTRTILGRVRTQVLSSIASSEVILCALHRGRGYQFDESIRGLVQKIESLGATSKSLHPLQRAELTAFAVLAGRRIKGPHVQDLGELVTPAALQLPLDRELFEAINSYIL